MKRNISDLLDCYLEEELEPDSTTYLSSRRIKEMTMKKISKKENDTNLRRLPSRIIIGVAAAAMLTVSAFAAGDALGAGELLRSYFTKGGEELTQGQVQTMDAIGTAFEGGVTSSGATLTPLAALADENVYYLRLRVQAPEGTVLPDLDEDTGYYQLSGDTAEESIDLDLSAYPGEYPPGYCVDFSWLPDQDPADNIKEVVVKFQVLDGEGEEESPLKFNDGISKPLTIHGLWVQSPDKNYTEMFKGEFIFDIGKNYESRSVALDCTGLSYQDKIGYTLYPQSMTLSPLSLSGQFGCTLMDNQWVGAGMGPVTIVLKDGSTFYDEPNYEPEPQQLAQIPLDEIPISDKVETVFRGTIVFDEPLDLSQVDYVEYGGQKIPVEVK